MVIERFPAIVDLRDLPGRGCSIFFKTKRLCQYKALMDASAAEYA